LTISTSSGPAEVAHTEGRLLEAVARVVDRRTPGFGHLAEAGRDDLMLETFVIDERRSCHRLFSARTMHAARNRMAEYHRTQARDTKARDHHTDRS